MRRLDMCWWCVEQSGMPSVWCWEGGYGSDFKEVLSLHQCVFGVLVVVRRAMLAAKGMLPVCIYKLLGSPSFQSYDTCGCRLGSALRFWRLQQQQVFSPPRWGGQCLHPLLDLFSTCFCFVLWCDCFPGTTTTTTCNLSQFFFVLFCVSTAWERVAYCMVFLSYGLYSWCVCLRSDWGMASIWLVSLHFAFDLLSSQRCVVWCNGLCHHRISTILSSQFLVCMFEWFWLP